MISMTVSVDKNFGIGLKNRLLISIPEDMKYFKQLTEGKIVIMGYNTYESLPHKPLPNRINIVLTRKQIELEGAIVKHSLEAVLELIERDYGDQEVFIIGGQCVYGQFLPYADRLYLTHIFEDFEADSFFPQLSQDWEIKKISGNREGIMNNPPYIFAVYERKNPEIGKGKASQDYIYGMEKIRYLDSIKSSQDL